jgi:hypothetical protein
MMKTENVDLTWAIDIIDKVVDVALKWMNSSDAIIRVELMKVFTGTSPELISHYIDKWDGDFAQFYLNADEGMRRKLFAYYSIPLEPDKYKDVNMALIKGVSRFDALPFESHVTHLFYRTAYNNSLKLLEPIAPETYPILVKKKMDLHGNGLNWSKAWRLLADYEKENVIEYIVKDEIELTKRQQQERQTKISPTVTLKTANVECSTEKKTEKKTITKI